MEIFKKILKWVFGILILLLGLVILFLAPITGMIFLFLGLLILPPTLKLFEQKTNLIFSSKAKWITVFVGLIIGVLGISLAGIDLAKEKGDKTFKTAVQFLEKGNIDSAKVYINQAKQEYASPNNKATELEKEIEKSDSVKFAIETLVKMPDSVFKKLEHNRLNKSYLKHKTLNKKFIALMKANASERAKRLKEIEERKKQERLEAERKRQEELKEERKELIKDQFSPWDGSHPALTKLIKERMGDPDSYEHIETRFRDDGNSIFVITRFRGANAFGGKVINTVTATVDFEGNVIEIKSWN